MKNIYLTGLVCLFSSLSISAQEPALLPKRLSPVNFTQVHFQDSFWLPKINVNRKVSIPSAFNECEKNGRFDRPAECDDSTDRGDRQGEESTKSPAARGGWFWLFCY